MEELSFMLMLSGIKLLLMLAVRHWGTGSVCCHIEAVVRLKSKHGKMGML